jgi:hypothetical protein
MNESILLDPSCLITSGELDGLFYKRTTCLKKAYTDMEEKGVRNVNFSNISLSPHLVGRVVDHYLGDYQVLKVRYGITDAIQLHRVAGLMAASICRFRPICLNSAKPTAEEASINEHFAIQVALSLCAECHAADGDDVAAALSSNQYFIGWVKRFKYLLRARSYTAEGLILAFETLCMTYFPKNFIHDSTYAPQ